MEQNSREEKDGRMRIVVDSIVLERKGMGLCIKHR